MANRILTGEPFSRNDVSKLAQLFEQSFDYYISHNTPFFSDYLNALRTVVGLGFTASLVDGLAGAFEQKLTVSLSQILFKA